MNTTTLVMWSLGTGIASALATGLGAFIARLMPVNSQVARGISSAFAAGMMIAASIFSLAQEGINMRAAVPWAPVEVIGGMLLGSAFFWAMERWSGGDAEEGGDEAAHGARLASLKLDRHALLLFSALFVHSIPEGVAIGVGFATGDVAFGAVMAAAIAIHNVPEGIAMSVPMRAAGASTARCFWTSTLTSLPQPLLAVPAALAFEHLRPLLPLGLGFAAGAMLYIVLVELLPNAFADAGRTRTAWGIMLGLCAMLGITLALGA